MNKFFRWNLRDTYHYSKSPSASKVTNPAYVHLIQWTFDCYAVRAFTLTQNWIIETISRIVYEKPRYYVSQNDQTLRPSPFFHLFDFSYPSPPSNRENFTLALLLPTPTSPPSPPQMWMALIISYTWYLVSLFLFSGL